MFAITTPSLFVSTPRRVNVKEPEDRLSSTAATTPHNSKTTPAIRARFLI
jgi:hypothetical protein